MQLSFSQLIPVLFWPSTFPMSIAGIFLDPRPWYSAAILFTGFFILYSILFFFCFLLHKYANITPVHIVVKKPFASFFKNAWAGIPGVIIWSYAYRASLTKQEREAVAAHEIGHWRQLALLQALYYVLFFVVSKFADLFLYFGIYPLVRPLMRKLLLLGQTPEFEADRYAVQQSPKFKPALISLLKMAGTGYLFSARIKKLQSH